MSRSIPSALEQDCIMGTFTHQPETYLPLLMASIARHLPQIQFEVVLREGKINENMHLLWERFRNSGKRWWLFLDHDIQFLHPDTVHDTIMAMLRNNWAIGGVYSVMRESALQQPYDELLARVTELFPNGTTREITFQPGYFILADSRKIGNLEPDLGLPDGNTAIDSTYCIETIARGHKLGIVPHVVYHTMKQVWLDRDAYERTVAYVSQKWGDFWFQNAESQGCVID